MGFFDKIVKEVERAGESLISSYEKVGKEAYRILTFESQKSALRRLKDPFGQREAMRKAARAQEALLEKQRREQESERLRLSKESALLTAERARSRRVQMAESLVGQEVGLYDTVPVDGTNLAANSIPSLDPVDDMGNSIPEVV